MVKKNRQHSSQGFGKTDKSIPLHLEKKLYVDDSLTTDELKELGEIMVNKHLAIVIRSKIETDDIKIPDNCAAPPEWLHSLKCLTFLEESTRWVDNEFKIRASKLYFDSEKETLLVNLYNVLHSAVCHTEFTIIY